MDEFRRLPETFQSAELHLGRRLDNNSFIRLMSEELLEAQTVREEIYLPSSDRVDHRPLLHPLFNLMPVSEGSQQ